METPFGSLDSNHLTVGPTRQLFSGLAEETHIHILPFLELPLIDDPGGDLLVGCVTQEFRRCR